MKKVTYVFMAAAAFAVASCSSEVTTETEDQAEAPVEEAVESMTYKLDTEASSLAWKGSEGDHEFHVGTIKFSEGSLTMKEEAVEEGSFTVDMASIMVTDEGMPEDKKGGLKGHLENADFFDVPQFATTTVSLGNYADGKLDITLTVLGKEVSASVPVAITSDENGASIKGDFSVDFSSVGMPGLTAEEGDDESISPEIDFTIDAVLTK